jgi:hypothetical protein
MNLDESTESVMRDFASLQPLVQSGSRDTNSLCSLR